MSVDLDEARLVVSELSLLKNSTLGLDSGLASSNDLSQSSNDQTASVSRRLSALSSIRGGVPPIGEFWFFEFKIENQFFYCWFNVSDETGSFDDLDDSLIPRWFYEPSECFDESSLLLHDNLGCIIDRESPIQTSFRDIQTSEYGPSHEFVRPPPNLNYIKVSMKIKTVFILVLFIMIFI